MTGEPLVLAAVVGAGAGVALTILSIVRLVRLARQPELTRAPVAETASVTFAEAGPVELALEGPHLTTLFRKACSRTDENCQNLVVIGGTYKTLCAHHILPFFGRFIVGYIPEEWIIGASKIPRVVEVHMRRLQSQEHLAHDIADTIEKILEPRGIAVWLGGVHLCMVMRGVEQESSFMETNVLRGEFLNDERTRQEFMSIVNRRGSRE